MTALEQLCTGENIPIQTAHSDVCGLSGVRGTLFVKGQVALEFFKMS